MRTIVDLARIHHFLVFHAYDSRRSEYGFPDLVMTGPSRTASGRPGRLLFVEGKAEKGELTDAQAVWLAFLRVVPGVEVYVWRPSQWEEAKRIIEEGP